MNQDLIAGFMGEIEKMAVTRKAIMNVISKSNRKLIHPQRIIGLADKVRKRDDKMALSMIEKAFGGAQTPRKAWEKTWLKGADRGKYIEQMFQLPALAKK